MKITLNILSYWRVGTGQGQDGALDATCARDMDGLPYIPGRQIRGLFREAVTDALDLRWIDGNIVNLFGDRQVVGQDNIVHDTREGTLRFESARLPTADRAALLAAPDLISRLFNDKRSTAINPDTGVAKNRSLRFEELAIPLTLASEVSALANAPTGWEKRLADAAPLIRGLGAGRNRGLGRVIVSCGTKGGSHE